MIRLLAVVIYITLLGCTDETPNTQGVYEVSYQDIQEVWDTWESLREEYLLERGWKKKGFIGQWYHPDLGTENSEFSAVRRWREVHGDD